MMRVQHPHREYPHLGIHMTATGIVATFQVSCCVKIIMVSGMFVTALSSSSSIPLLWPIRTSQFRKFSEYTLGEKNTLVFKEFQGKPKQRPSRCLFK